MNQSGSAAGRVGATGPDAAAADWVDAHLHLWQLEPGRYSWLGPQHGVLHRSFDAADAWTELSAAGIGRAILVQAEDSTADTEFMLATAEANPWIAGVVGWVQLDDPAAAARQLELFGLRPAFAGVRHLIHDDPRSGFLALASVRKSLALLAGAGLPLDVPNAFPGHLGDTVDAAAELEELTVVVDHLAKPPVDDAGLADWEAQLRRLAPLPNVAAKISGLHEPGRPYSAAALRRIFDIALDVFGPARLMYGGDWPVSLLGAPYAQTQGVLAELVSTLSPAEQCEIQAGTARRIYARAAW
ncbi:amidohydrolase family protein [Arthrobacter sp. 35W]|uniref:amidohydrolase family protein n=1 Tax=Arthrobacter sp. 35W TaxID=1132441 RepID=UPI00041140A3|nr:amidohydrolase family protein [Arthrobacter sp. 35W]